ncbi:MAG: hypothetical protein Q9181_002485 [Wetmoreana brouardii]
MLERKGDKSAGPSLLDYDHNRGSHNATLPRRDYNTIEGRQESQTAPTISSNIDDTIPSAQSSSKASAGCLEASPLLSRQGDPHGPKAHRSPFFILLTTPRMLAAILGDFVESLVFTELESTLPLYIKTVFAYDSSKIGLIFLTLALPSFGAPFVGFLSDRYGAKTMVSLGFFLAAFFCGALRLISHDTAGQAALLCVILSAIGVALVMVLTPVFAEAKAVVDKVEKEKPGVFGENGAYAQAFGLMNMAYAGGSLVGPLLGGILLLHRIAWPNLMLGTGGLCLPSAIACFYATGGRTGRGKLKPKSYKSTLYINPAKDLAVDWGTSNVV